MKKTQLNKLIKEEVSKALKEDDWPSLSSLAGAVEEEENAYNIAVTIANNIDKYDISPTSLGTVIAYILKEKYGKQHSRSLISAIQKELNKKPIPPQDPSEL